MKKKITFERLLKKLKTEAKSYTKTEKTVQLYVDKISNFSLHLKVHILSIFFIFSSNSL